MKSGRLRKVLASLLMLSMLLSAVPALAAVPAADSVYINGNIYTMDDDNPHATAMAISGDRLVYVGDASGVQAYIGSGTVVNDLRGQTVLPGLIEGHMHVPNLGQSMLMIDAFWKPKDVILQAVKEAAEAAEPGEWIQGRGWMNTVWEDDSFPTKEELDAVAPNNPVSLQRADAHMFWFNSMALEMAGITKDTPNPQGGEILKTEDGEVLGCLTDTAAAIVRGIIPPWSDADLKRASLLAQEQLFSYGFTSALDAGVSVHQLDLYKELYASGELKLRLYPLIMLASTEGPEADYCAPPLPPECCMTTISMWPASRSLATALWAPVPPPCWRSTPTGRATPVSTALPMKRPMRLSNWPMKTAIRLEFTPSATVPTTRCWMYMSA